MAHSSNQRHTGTLVFKRETFSIRPKFCTTLRKTNRKVLQEMVLLKELAQTHRQVFPEFSKSCPNLAPNSQAYSSNAETWQNISYLLLGGLINSFYVVITIFAQHLNICSPKLGEWRCLLPLPGYTSGKCYWWLCGFDPLVRLETRRQLTLATKRQIWHA